MADPVPQMVRFRSQVLAACLQQIETSLGDLAATWLEIGPRLDIALHSGFLLETHDGQGGAV